MNKIRPLSALVEAAFPSARSLWNTSLGRPLFGLAAASAVALVLLALRILGTGQWRELYLAWNLFLALVPLACAWVLRQDLIRGQFTRVRLFATAGFWFLFFPNAPYIFTDMVHLVGRHGTRLWVDMILISLFALTGFISGFISLFLMHGVVRRLAGWMTGWSFVITMAGLSGVAVYLGRFLRWNSWDLLINPLALMKDTAGHFLQTWNHPLTLIFPLLFAVFVLVSYTMLYSLTYLPRHLHLWDEVQDEAPSIHTAAPLLTTS